MAIADFDGDGDSDVVVAGFGLWLFRGDGTGALAAPTEIPFAGQGCNLDVGDIDADGFLDLVVATRRDNDGWVLFGDGTGAFPATHDLTTAGGTAAGCNSVLTDDLDGNGKPDVVFSSGSANRVTFLRNTLSGRPR